MGYSVLSVCTCCSILLSVGNRFLASIQQHKMSVSGGRESDEYIHLYPPALSLPLTVHASAVHMCLCTLEFTAYHVILHMCMAGYSSIRPCMCVSRHTDFPLSPHETEHL